MWLGLKVSHQQLNWEADSPLQVRLLDDFFPQQLDCNPEKDPELGPPMQAALKFFTCGHSVK